MSWWNWFFGATPAPAARLKAWALGDDNTETRLRVDIGELNAYIKAIERVCDEYFASLPVDVARDILVTGTIRADGKIDLPITTTVAGFLEPEILCPLYDRLFALPVPAVKGESIAFQAVLAIWGGSPGQPFGV